jgi:hypothetical protein
MGEQVVTLVLEQPGAEADGARARVRRFSAPVQPRQRADLIRYC